MEIFLAILIGLCFGSFVTLASWRLPMERSLVTPGSHCPKCQHALGARDLLPVLSWAMNGGKCRHCQARVSIRYPLTELACAALWLLAYFHSGLTVEGLVLALFGTALLTMLVADLETTLIPDEIHLFLIPLGLAYHWLLGTPWAEVVACTLIAGGIGLVLHYGYYYLRGYHGLGFGDVKFLFVSGLWLASADQFAAFIFYSGVLGVATGLLWKLIHKDSRFPFAPALALALYLLAMWPQSAQVFWQIIGGLTRLI